MSQLNVVTMSRKVTHKVSRVCVCVGGGGGGGGGGRANGKRAKGSKGSSLIEIVSFERCVVSNIIRSHKSDKILKSIYD